MTLKEFFKTAPKAAVAFSGGVDSAYLLYSAKRYADEIKAYYVKSEFQPQFELKDALQLAKELDVEIEILELKILRNENVAANPKNRCYHCKKDIFTAIAAAAKKDGFTLLLDGTNYSDKREDRPGMTALEELEVVSPLRECGLTKEEIRSLSREAGLFTWDKPAYACLATRIPEGERITCEKLAATESAENYLFSLGFTDFRVRSHDGNGLIQIREQQWELFTKHREDILNSLKENYKTVALDLEVRG